MGPSTTETRNGNRRLSSLKPIPTVGFLLFLTLLVFQTLQLSNLLGNSDTAYQAALSQTELPSQQQQSPKVGEDKILSPATVQFTTPSPAVPLYCSTGALAPLTTTTTHNTTTSVDSLCRCVSYWTQGKSQSAATSLWNLDHVKKKIHLASQESFEECFGTEGVKDFDVDDDYSRRRRLTNLTDRMFDMLNSRRLKKSITNRPNPFVMERVVQVVLKRLADPTKNPPLRIAVFGGSVVEGRRADVMDDNYFNFTAKSHAPARTCAYSFKLERVLNHLLQPYYGDNDNDAHKTAIKVVEVKNLAIASTDSIQGTMLLEFDFLGERMNRYDIIISSFGTNDLEAPKAEFDRIYLGMQTFLRMAKAQRPCSDLPLVIQIDESVGENKPQARDRLRYYREMVETTRWAGFMSLSYVDAIREEFLADMSHSFLYEKDLHPGYNFHTGMAWTIAYNLLEGALDACDASSLPEHDHLEPRGGLPLPLLRHDLLWDEITTLWNQQSKDNTRLCQRDVNARTGNVCEWKYIAHRLSSDTKEKVNATISKVATNIQGWEAIGYKLRRPRRTWLALQQNASFTIQLDGVKNPINQLLVQYLKSYGKEWESTRLEVVVEGKPKNQRWTELKRVELTGVHDAKTSIMYSERIKLGEDFLKQGSSVRATFNLIGGDRFQINGLAFCHVKHSVEL